ncbi:hypothetical protein JCM24511_09740 [Saitozyma sp. JCM 24511]|nr:hypothetical protein JCM24511_09740 [Saitozyma sp. JCM 24511]
MILTLPSGFLHWTDIVPPLAESWDTLRVVARGSDGASPERTEVPPVETVGVVENAAVGWAVHRREKAVVR